MQLISNASSKLEPLAVRTDSTEPVLFAVAGLKTRWDDDAHARVRRDVHVSLTWAAAGYLLLFAPLYLVNHPRWCQLIFSSVAIAEAELVALMALGFICVLHGMTERGKVWKSIVYTKSVAYGKIAKRGRERDELKQLLHRYDSTALTEASALYEESVAARERHVARLGQVNVWRLVGIAATALMTKFAGVLPASWQLPLLGLVLLVGSVTFLVCQVALIDEKAITSDLRQVITLIERIVTERGDRSAKGKPAEQPPAPRPLHDIDPNTEATSAVIPKAKRPFKRAFKARPDTTRLN